ncbi:MAG: LamG domain-containing protein [Kofleriaceae bacterium]
MKATWLVGVVLVGCSFSPGAATDPGDTTDAALPIGDDAAPIDTTTATTVVPCGTPDASGLVLCLEFEDGVDDGVLLDSSPNHRDAMTSGLVAAMRTVPATSTAGHVAAASTIRVPANPALDVGAAYTYSAWVHPASLPAQGVVYGLFDHEQQYAMLIAHAPITGELETRCVHTGVQRYEWTSILPVGEWTFLACTWDGVQLCANRWTSATSHERFCHVPTIPPNAAGAQGLAIGQLSDAGSAHSPLDGDLDSVQLYSRGMSADQLCALAGQPAGCLPCNAGC